MQVDPLDLEQVKKSGGLQDDGLSGGVQPGVGGVHLAMVPVISFGFLVVICFMVVMMVIIRNVIAWLAKYWIVMMVQEKIFVRISQSLLSTGSTTNPIIR